MQIRVRIDDELLRLARQLAADQGITFSALLEQALKELLLRRSPNVRLREPLPTYKGRGVQPGVNLDDSGALRDLMDAAEVPR